MRLKWISRRIKFLAVVAILALGTLFSSVVLADLTKEPAQLVSTSPDWSVTPTFTVGETVGPGGYLPPGILDGVGSGFKVDRRTVRVYVNHELNVGSGYTYQLANGTTLDGARVSWFDIDTRNFMVKDGGLGYDTIYDRFGVVVTDPAQLGGGVGRLCSARGVNAGEYGFVDNIHLAGEEIGNGNLFALDVDSGELWTVPAAGRFSWENVTPIATNEPNNVALIIGDDIAPAPLWLYIGEKNGVGDGSFLDRNGLAQGQLYYWVGAGVSTPADFNGTGYSATGTWQPIDVLDGGGNQRTADSLRNEAFGNGAFQFSRPEDVHENPDNPTEVVLGSTGRGSLFGGADDWGTTYIIDNRFNPDGSIAFSNLRIVYDGDDAGAGQFPHPDFGLRSPDNLTWAGDGFIYLQEDRATQINTFGGVSGEEASIWQLDPENGKLERIFQVDRSAIPTGQTDIDPTDLGDWETSGILDVTHLFKKGKSDKVVLIADVQAHSLRGAPIIDQGLVQGGQLVFLTGKGDSERDDNDDRRGRGRDDDD